MRLWLLFFHILMALWLAGGAFGGIVARAQVRRAKTLEEKVYGLRTALRLMGVYGLPGAIGVGAVGMILVTEGPYSFGSGWIAFSMLIYFFLLANTLFYLAPKMRRLSAAAEASLEAGAPTPEFERLAAAKLPGILADVNALGIVVITLLMVLKHPA